MVHHITISPTRPPAVANRTLSVSNWRTMRARPAPRAARVASSFSRAMLRASSRLATLTDAMINTKPMPASRIISAGRMLPTD
jgi:hypothetical protein